MGRQFELLNIEIPEHMLMEAKPYENNNMSFYDKTPFFDCNLVFEINTDDFRHCELFHTLLHNQYELTLEIGRKCMELVAHGLGYHKAYFQKYFLPYTLRCTTFLFFFLTFF